MRERDPWYIPAYYYPPVPSVGVLRTKELVRVLRELGHRVYVVTRQLDGDSLPDDRDAQRVFAFDYRAGLSLRSGQGFAPSSGIKERPSYRLFRSLAEGFPSNLVFGEGAFVYMALAYCKLSQAIGANGGRGVLYSSFMPAADHYIAYLLKRRYPNLLWWQDWRDTPFDRRRAATYWPPLQRRAVASLLCGAEVCSAVSAGVANDLAALGPRPATLYNGMVGQHPVVTETSSVPLIVYTGSLYGANRDPRPLMRILAELSGRDTPFKLCYAGKDSAAWTAMATDSGLPTERFSDLGLLPRAKALELQKRAAINILLTWANPGQTGGVTMKMFEYLQAGQPILRIHDGSPDPEIDDILAQSSAPILTFSKNQSEERILRKWVTEQVVNYKVNPCQTEFALGAQLKEFIHCRILSELRVRS